MNNDTHDILMNLFDQTEKECIEIGDQYINEAKTKGSKFTDKFEQNQKVVNYLNVLKFFESNKILGEAKDAEEMLCKFEGFISKTMKLIE